MTTKESSRVWIDYETDSTGGEVEDSNDRWSSRTPRYTELKVKSLYKSEPQHLFFKDSLEVEDPKVLECQHVYLVVVRYQDGDSFGTCYGNFQFYSVRATQQEALADKAVIEMPSKEGDYGSYRPWEGYFNRLQRVEIQVFALIP